MHSFFKDKLFYGWIITGAGFFIGFIGLGARFSYGVYLKSLEVDFGITRGAASGIFSVNMLFCCLLAILGGWAMDRYGPRKVGVFMGTLTGLSFLLTSLVRAPWQLLITYSLLLALGTGPLFTVVNATTSRWFVTKRGLAVGITSAGGGVGTIFIAPFTTFLILTFNWRTAFIVMGFIAWIGMVVFSLLLIKDPRDYGDLPDGVKSLPSQNDISKSRRDLQPADLTLVQAVRTTQFWFMGAIWLLSSVSLHMIIIHVVPYAIDMGISPMDAAFILSLMGFSNISGRLLVGKLSDTLDRKTLGILCTVIQSGTLFWLMWAGQLWMFYTFAIIFGFLWGGSSTVITAFTADIFGTRNLGAIMGIMSGGFAIGAAIGPAIGGYIYEMSGHYLTAYGAGAGALFVTAGFMTLLRKV